MKPDISKTNMYEITGCGFDSQRGRGISKFSLEKKVPFYIIMLKF